MTGAAHYCCDFPPRFELPHQGHHVLRLGWRENAHSLTLDWDLHQLHNGAWPHLGDCVQRCHKWRVLPRTEIWHEFRQVGIFLRHLSPATDWKEWEA